MGIREEQCNKVCRILDDVLVNRPTERDSLIVAVRKAFEALELFGNSEQLPSAQPKQRWISEQDMTDKLTRLINEFEMIMSDIREKEVDDSVCGLCEYDADHGMDGYANECPGFEKDDCFRLKDEYRKQWMSINY